MDQPMLIKKIKINCPMCGKSHLVELRSITTTNSYHNEQITYQEHFLHCTNVAKKYQDFVTGNILDNNVARCKNAYNKKHNLPCVKLKPELEYLLV